MTSLSTFCPLLCADPSLQTSSPSPQTSAPSPQTRAPSPEIIAKAQSLINSIQVLEIISLSLAPPLHTKVLSLLPRLLRTLHSPFTAIRHMSARGIASLTKVDLHHTMEVQF